jgi:hypothetical protein
VQDFLRTDVAGEALWINPPFAQAGNFLAHYLSCKDKSPDNTCALIVLPYWPRRSWWQLTARFKAVRYYPAGTQLFSAPPDARDAYGSRRVLGPTRWPVVVFYDAATVYSKPGSGRSTHRKVHEPATATVAHATASSAVRQDIPTVRVAAKAVESDGDSMSASAVDAPLIVLKGNCGGTRVKVLLDSGAEKSFASTSFVASLAIVTYPSAVVHSVRMADGRINPVCRL